MRNTIDENWDGWRDEPCRCGGVRRAVRGADAERRALQARCGGYLEDMK